METETPFHLAGVIGWPIAHSLSPRLHGAWIQHYEIKGAYVPLAVTPDHLKDALRALPKLGFRGVNITIPHKTTALDVMDHVDPLALRVGAVNTVVIREDGSLEGRNTDVFGFCENVCSAGVVAPLRGPAVVLGAGGAARAVVAGLQQLGATAIRLVNRSREKAERLREDLGSEEITCMDLDDLRVAMDGAVMLVNATPLGMKGHPPLEMDLSALPSSAWVVESVYNPLETGLLRQARARGNPTVDGLGMLIHQARPGFEAWFGLLPEVVPGLRRLLESAL